MSFLFSVVMIASFFADPEAIYSRSMTSKLFSGTKRPTMR